MRYLYFQPKPTLQTNYGWTSSHHQKISQLLESCSMEQELLQIHAQMIRTRLVEDHYLVSRIITFFTSPSHKSRVNYARRVFDEIDHPNLFTWNSMMRAYTHQHAAGDAFVLFKEMHRCGVPPDSYTFSILTSASARLSALQTGRMVHAMITKIGLNLDMFSMTGFINFYVSCGKVHVARKVFEEMPERDVVSWTSMIAGYVQLNQWNEAFLLFDRMKSQGVEPNEVTITTLLSACGQSQALDRGRSLHSLIAGSEMQRDVVVGNSLVNMYAKCGATTSALEVFERMTTRDTTTWNSLIGGFLQNNLHAEALTIFESMKRSDERPNEITLVNVLLACAQVGDLHQGKLIHSYIEEHMITWDVFLRNALISMYAKCGDLTKAEAVFHEMPERDVFSWTAMISGYVQEKHCREALTLFEEMWVSDVEPNEVTLVSILSACAQLGALDQGQFVHNYIEEHKLKIDICLGNALIDMYAKCGCIEIASQLFGRMTQKDIFTWNTMIGGLAANGQGKAALDLFNQMQIVGDPKPDNLTLMAILGACSHSGMVNEGFYYFNSMRSLYGLIPGVEHYGCMVDLLARAGLIEEAHDFIKTMPMATNPVIWGSLLAACPLNGKLELGERIAQHIIELAPDDEGILVLVSNLYAEEGRWDDVRRVRALMGSKGIEKAPGCSTI